MSQGAPAVLTEGLRRAYGRFEALRGLSLRLERGLTVALVGPNGAGKTTLLKLIARLTSPSAGRLEVLGHDSRRQAEEVLRKVGFLTHQPYLYEPLSAYENVVFFGRLYGLADVKASTRRALERVGLGPEHRDKPVSALSRGLRQRAGIARALVHEPELLLLDEPFSGLDPTAAATLEGVLVEHRAAGRSCVVTTHALERARQLSDRIVMLVRGRVAFERDTAGLDAAEFHQLFDQAARGL